MKQNELKVNRQSSARVREPLIVVEGYWDLEKCDGADSAQNPQVQLLTNRVTLLTAEMQVQGACGNTIQLWVLRGCCWGVRKPKLVNVLTSVSSSGDSQGPRHLLCECELPPNEVITLVLACDGQGKDKKEKDEEEVLSADSTCILQREYSSLLQADPHCWPAAAVYLRCAHKKRQATAPNPLLPSRSPPQLSKLFVSKMADGANSNQFTSQGFSSAPPTFKLAILTRSPLAQGPMLLLPLHKVEVEASEVLKRKERRATTVGMSRLPAPRASLTEMHQETDSKAGQVEKHPKAVTHKEEVQINPEIIPGFAKLYLNAGDRLDEKLARSTERFSAQIGREWRLTASEERKQVFRKSTAFYNWKHWYRLLMSLGPTARRAYRLQDYAKEKRFGKSF